MKKKFNGITAGLLVAAVLCAGLAWANRHAAERRLLEYGINLAAREYFAGTLRLSQGYLDRKLRIHMFGFRGDFQTANGPVPIEIQSLESRDPLTRLAAGAPVLFTFKGARPALSKFEGIRGMALLKGGRDGRFKLRAKIVDLGLEDVAWLNPENLQGSSGRMTGFITLRSDARKDPVFGLQIKVSEPGGHIQAKFFDLLLPYLPSMKTREEVSRLAAEAGLMVYRKAEFSMQLDEPDKLKVFFHIEVPDYNLHLNLNILIRTDEKNSFMKLTQMMGLVQIKAGGAGAGKPKA